MSWMNKLTQKARDEHIYNTLHYAKRKMTEEQRAEYLNNWESYNPTAEFKHASGYDKEMMITVDADPEYIEGGKVTLRKVDLTGYRLPTVDELPYGLNDEEWEGFKKAILTQFNKGND